ncbi:MAG: type II toxin-antitoxin system VapC family toxin [bacterium]
MRKKMDKMTEVFLDAAYAIALSSPSDQYHERAKVLAEQLEADGTQLITTLAVLLEIGNALAKQRYRAAAIELLDSLQEDPDIEIIPISEDLFNRAFLLYCERQDKEWGLTDCISFVVMKDRGLLKALTTDEHFKQAGFQALLL